MEKNEKSGAAKKGGAAFFMALSQKNPPGLPRGR